MTDDPGPSPRLLHRADGATLAYHRSAGTAPGVVFLTGYRSDMTGGFGVHSVLEGVGTEQAIRTAVGIARPEGAVGR